MKKQILNTESYSPLYKQLMQKLRADIAFPRSRSCAKRIR